MINILLADIRELSISSGKKLLDVTGCVFHPAAFSGILQEITNVSGHGRLEKKNHVDGQLPTTLE